MKRWLLRLGMLLGAPLLVLVLIEVVWQLIGDPRIAENEAWLQTVAPHSRLGAMGILEVDAEAEVSFHLTPGFEATVEGQVYRVNSHGMRGAEVELDRTAGVKRILLIGDSYAFGYGVGEPATISAQLQARLAQAHPGVEVLNMGVPAYHTGQAARRLERDGLAFEPDLVVLVYYANDNIGPTLMYDSRFKVIHFDEMPFSYQARHTLSGSILYSRVTKGYTQYLTRSGAMDTRGLRHWSKTRKRLLRVVELCAAAPTRFLLVALPFLSHSRELALPEHAINKAHDRLLTFAADQGIAVVDIRAPLLALLAREVPIETLFVKPREPQRDTHFNGEGYRIVVDQVVAAIAANKSL